MREQIYYNGNIITMEQSLYEEALLVRNGIIDKVGSKEEIIKYKNSQTELIDLQGKTLMPSFIDSHSHLTSFAGTLNLVVLSDTISFQDIIDKMKKFKDENNLKKGQWIIGFGYDNNFLVEKQHPTKEILDKISTDNPIMITHKSGHMGVLNSLGLEEVDINSNTKESEGGHIGRVGGTREPNGYLEENCFIQASNKIPEQPIETLGELMEKAQNIYLSYGITTAQEGLINDAEFKQLKYMSENNKLKIDVVGYVDLKNSKKIKDENEKYVKNYINRFKIGGYKIFLDGSPQGRTAWMTKPYENDKEGYCGYPIYRDEEVQEFINTALNENMQLLTHCNGDAAADQLINSFIEVFNKKDYSNTNRPVMIHAQLVREDQIDKMKKIDMIPSYFIAHTYYWGDIHIKNFGRRAYKISPVKTTIDKGVVYTFHQDTPVIAPNMLETIWCAVNRISKNGIIIGEDERISPLDALKAVTINAAYEYFEEDKKGSIREGKLADLVILDKNPLNINHEEIKNIKVLKTIKEGNVVYSV